MTDWDELLAVLGETPRENGTPELHRAAGFLLDALHRAGADAQLVPFMAHPWALRLAGVFALAAGLLYFRSLRAGRRGTALAAAIAFPALLLALLELQLPVFGPLGAQTQHHVLARLPSLEPRQLLLFTAHYDTKTDLLDHAQREPLESLAAALIGLMLAAPLVAGRGGRWGRLRAGLAEAAAWGAAAHGVLVFVALSGGAFAPTRSPGALDDGASCAVLVRLAGVLASAGPLSHTDVEIVLLSAEEVGVQGSWRFARERFGDPPALPTRVINLEGLGASARHGVLPRERFLLRALSPDPGLVALLDAVHRQRFGEPLVVATSGGATDARSFLAHGIPAATLFSLESGSSALRGLHSSRDARSRLDEAALEASVGYLAALARAADGSLP